MDKKFSIKIVLFFTLLSASAAVLQGCKKEFKSLRAYNPIANTKLDSVRIFNLLPDSSNSPRTVTYALYVNDSLFYTNAAMNFTNSNQIPGSPPVIPVSANGGSYVFKMARYVYSDNYNLVPPPHKPNPAMVVYTSQPVSIPPHSGFSNMVFYVDATGAYKSHYFPQAATNEPPPGQGKYKIRVVNFGYDIPMFGPYNSRYTFPQYPLNSAGKQFPVQLQYADSTIVAGMSAVPFGTASPYVQLDYGTQQFLVYNRLPDSAKYIQNSHVLNNMTDAFGMSPLFQNPYQPIYVNEYPYYTNVNYGFPAGTILGNVGSYPFNAGGVYTIYIFGNMYNAVLDRQYSPGTLDNLGQLQVVNANYNQQDMQVSIRSGSGTVQIPSVRFGSYTNPAIVPAGDITITFSSQGNVLYTYQTQIPRLGNYTIYYTSNLNNVPVVFPQSNNLNTPDFGTITTPDGASPVMEMTKISLLNISPDAGPLFVTSNPTGGSDARISGDLSYESIQPQLIYDGRPQTTGTLTGLPDVFNIRLSSARTDSLASKLAATYSRKSLFRSLPAPGTYTLAVAGLLNTTDPAKKIKIIMIKQSNYISKAK